MDRYTPDTPDDLRQVLAKLDDGMAVDAASDSGITATTVGALRQLTALPPSGITLSIPRPIYPESAVKVEKRATPTPPSP
jgi:hypothetical protein